ncbi:MAG: Holliday junction branch migration protein RuvA [Candidatus Absconditicoccaceae bacterium]
MLHYFRGDLKVIGNKKYLVNELFGIQVNYLGSQKKGEFFLYPYLDDNKKSVFYYCFNTADQKEMFEETLKISGIGPKTAFQIVKLPKADLQKAIKTLDVKYFQSIPGIGPKSAKKILLELKGNFDMDDLEKLDIDQKLYKSIITSLKGFGYEADTIKRALQKYDGKVTKENIPTVIKRIISNI